MASGTGDPYDRRRQTAVACIVSAGAGITTRWLAEAPVLVLCAVAAAAVVLVLAMPRAAVRAVLGGALLGATAARLPEMRVEDVVQGVAAGLLTALVLAGPMTIRRAVQRRRDFQRRGWELAATESRRRASEIDAAVQRERMTLAAEMHDGLGHSLTLIAVRLGQLSLAPSLSDDDRAQVSGIREAAAEAAEQLGLGVRLLRRTDDPAAGWTRPSIDESIDGARRAGLVVDAHIGSGVEDRLSEEAANAVARVIQEGLTNAAKHAPGQPVTIRVGSDEDTVVAEISNPLPERGPERRTPESGFGLFGLRHRAAVLGGDLAVEATSERFSLTLVLPLRARPTADEAPRHGDIVAAEGIAATATSRATHVAVALPVAILSALAFVAVGYFVLANTLSVMSSTAFAQITVADDRASAERALPVLEMLDPPTAEFPARAGEECVYYEAEISFFERVDVYVVCFEGGQVSRTGTVAS